MKQRNWWVYLLAGVAGTVVGGIVYDFIKSRCCYDEDYCDEGDCYEDDLDPMEEAEEDEEWAEALDQSYDEGFEDGMNGDYRGNNPAARALQKELDSIVGAEPKPIVVMVAKKDPDTVESEATESETTEPEATESAEGSGEATEGDQA